MKNITHVLNIAIFTTAALGTSVANATLTRDFQRGEQLVQHAVPGEPNEVCVIPKHFPGAKYSDKDLEKEGELCALETDVNIAVCPKLESTNPGLNFHSIPEGMTAKQVEAKNCEVPNPDKPKENLADKEAKYKLSVSCSYTPSLLGYYHMSRILGGIGAVPPAVLRTFDLEHHIELGEKAMKLAPAGDTIALTWSGLLAHLKKGAASSKKDLLFTDDFEQSYGALQKNPKKEETYKALYNGGADNHKRAIAFKAKNPIYAQVVNPASVTKMISRTFNADNLQKFMQMKDVSEFILLDSIMSQEDRFGNLHMVDTSFYYETKDGATKLKSDTNMKKEEIAEKNAITIKTMLMKDNDCGVSRENVMMVEGLNKGIAHVDPKVYKRILKLDTVADSDDVKKFFKQGFLFTESDYSTMRSNLKKIATQLKAACDAGKLQLDLDPEAYFSGQPLPAQKCEI